MPTASPQVVPVPGRVRIVIYRDKQKEREGGLSPSQVREVASVPGHEVVTYTVGGGHGGRSRVGQLGTGEQAKWEPWGKGHPQ